MGDEFRPFLGGPDGGAFQSLAWSWWTQPRAQVFDDKLYVGGVTPTSGVARVDAFDISTSTIESTTLATLEDDDHDNPALLLSAGKPGLAFYAKHAADTLLRYRKGSQAIESGLAPMAAESTITIGPSVTYAQAHNHSGDVVDVLCRTDVRYWAHVRSTDWGDTWGTVRQVFASGVGRKLYMATRLAGSTLRCAMSVHPNDGGDQEVYYAEIDLTSGDITVPGSASVLGNLLDGTNLPLSVGSLQAATTITSGYLSWVYDVTDGDDPAIVWTSFDGTDMAATGKYHYSVRSGGSWATYDIATIGASPLDDGANYYTGGAQAKSGGDVVYVSRFAGGDWRIERCETSDGGQTWDSTLLASSARQLVRPWPVDGPVSGAEVAYVDFSSYVSYTDFAGNVVVR